MKRGKSIAVVIGLLVLYSAIQAQEIHKAVREDVKIIPMNGLAGSIDPAALDLY